MKQVVIKAQGKQYLVAEGQKIEIDKVEGKKGDKITFDQVLGIIDGEKSKIGTPLVKEAKVEGMIEAQKRTAKIDVVKFKSKKRYHRSGTHRQSMTVVTIGKIND